MRAVQVMAGARPKRRCLQQLGMSWSKSWQGGARGEFGTPKEHGLGIGEVGPKLGGPVTVCEREDRRFWLWGNSRNVQRR